MTRISVTIFALFAVLVAPVLSDDTTRIPEDLGQVETWFNTNVKPAAERKGTLNATLEAAEAEPPKIIKVMQDGSGEFKTLTDAIKSIPDGNTKRVVVKIGPGEYKEKVEIDKLKPFVTLYGDPNAMPKILYGGTAAQYGTIDSATLIVESDFFMGVNLEIVNTAPMPGPKELNGAQALAVRISGERGAFYKCKFIGFQDTLCDHKGFHFFKDCHIEGTVDFIFGYGTSLYLGTELHVVGDGLRFITAHARQKEEDTTGYSFVHGKVTGTGTGAIYLGRAWMSHPKVVFSYTDMGSIVHPEGWSNNFKPERNKTVFYGEYKCKGPGASTAGRVDFTQDLDEKEIAPFLSLAYIQGTSWLLPPPKL